MPPDLFLIQGIVLIVELVFRRLGEIGKLIILILGKCSSFCGRFLSGVRKVEVPVSKLNIKCFPFSGEC